MLPLPQGHRFPMSKYALLRQRLRASGLFTDAAFQVPAAAADEDLLRVHCPDYLAALQTGTLERSVERRIGFPWSKQMVERSRRSVGGTLGAARTALAESLAVNLAGGTHHAFHDTGAGFCVLNDVVVAARWAQARAGVGQVLVVDLDVHQGDGTAALCRDDASIFTFSVHGEKNYPARKQLSDLDVALADGTGDEDYLAALASHLPALVQRLEPDMAFYLAGADPFQGDRLGRLGLTKQGLARRDQFVFDTLRRSGISTVVCMAGGYAEEVEDIVDIHAATVIEALRQYQLVNGDNSPAGPGTPVL